MCFVVVVVVVVGVGVVVVAVFFPQVAFERYQHEFHPRAVLGNLAHPFGFHVFEGVGGVDLLGGKKGRGFSERWGLGGSRTRAENGEGGGRKWRERGWRWGCGWGWGWGWDGGVGEKMGWEGGGKTLGVGDRERCAYAEA